MDPEVKAMLERWEQDGITPESILGIEERGMQTDEEPLIGAKPDGRSPRWWFALFWVVLVPAALMGVLWGITNESARKSDMIATQEAELSQYRNYAREGWDYAWGFETQMPVLELQLSNAEDMVDQLIDQHAVLEATIEAPLPTPFPPTPLPPRAEGDEWVLDMKPVPHEINCDDAYNYNGYYLGEWASNFCVPGLITPGSQSYTAPEQFYGLMSSYAEGVMERMCEINGPCPQGHKGIAIASCGMIGKTAWLRIPGWSNWRGPYLIVDCSQREHSYYHHVQLGLAVEVGYQTTQDWGFIAANRIDVHIGNSAPASWNGSHIGWWWATYVLEWEFRPE